MKGYIAVAIVVVLVLASPTALAARRAGFGRKKTPVGSDPSELIKLLDDKDPYKRVYAIYNIANSKAAQKMGGILKRTLVIFEKEL